MIDVFNVATSHMYGDTLRRLHECRYREFVQRHKYEVPVYNGMEYDQYDTPAAVYFTWKDNAGAIRSGLRIVPTTRPYMIGDMWPKTVESIALPREPETWEATRFFVDKSSDAALRHSAHGHILSALLEFGLHYGITRYIATAPPKLWDYTFRRCGWPVEHRRPVDGYWLL